MRKPIDLTGQKFNRLTAIERVETKWRFRCDCGIEIVAFANNVKRGGTTSCGCYHREQMAARSTTHGNSSHELFGTYTQMLNRCLDPKHAAYKNYGGRGVKVCARWLESFESFIADMGDRPEGMTLDRFPDASGNYEPGNVRWATTAEQNRNTRRNVLVTVGEITQTVRDWEIAAGVGKGTFQRRIDLGWPPARAVTESIQPGKPLEYRV
jgi:hypothetical protein